MPGRTLERHAVRRCLRGRVPLDYLLHVPETRPPAPALLLFLHGAGERGSQPERVATHGVPKVIERGDPLPFVCASPQCPSGSSWNELADCLLDLLEELIEENGADRQRLYLTGLSMGGYGCWKLAAELPRTFAAMAAVCGGGNPKWAPKLQHTPIWAFHGDQDRVVPVTQTLEMVQALQAVGAPVKLTVYEGVGHDSWTETYDNPELYVWLTSHVRA